MQKDSDAPSPDAFPVPARRSDAHIEIKRSRFIATADEACSQEEVKALVADLRRQFPDANHHCWACVAGAPDDVYGYNQSDDGEPRGTAGKPMLNVLRHSGLGRIAVVVTRFFGGTKLGAGGLVRAYGQAVNAVLEDLPTRRFEIRETVRVTLPYSALDSFEHWLREQPATVADKTFAEQVVLVLLVPRSAVHKLIDRIEDHGQGRFHVVQQPGS